MLWGWRGVPGAYFSRVGFTFSTRRSVSFKHAEISSQRDVTTAPHASQSFFVFRNAAASNLRSVQVHARSTERVVNDEEKESCNAHEGAVFIFSFRSRQRKEGGGVCPYNASPRSDPRVVGTEHVGLSPRRQTLLCTKRETCREVLVASHGR